MKQPTNVFKLTTQEYMSGIAYKATHWVPGVTLSLPTSPDPKLCSKDVFHVYRSPYHAAVFNDIHCAHSNPVLWLCHTPEIVVEDKAKAGVISITPIEIVQLPAITPRQFTEIAIRAALTLCGDDEVFTAWADRWRSNPDIAQEEARLLHKKLKPPTTFLEALASSGLFSAVQQTWPPQWPTGYALELAAQLDPTLDIISLIKGVLDETDPVPRPA